MMEQTPCNQFGKHAYKLSCCELDEKISTTLTLTTKLQPGDVSLALHEDWMAGKIKLPTAIKLIN